jgi:hypothetical protein
VDVCRLSALVGIEVNPKGTDTQYRWHCVSLF